MSLFDFKRKKKEKQVFACSGLCDKKSLEEEKVLDNGDPAVCNKGYCIKILGGGCSSCQTLLKNTQRAVKTMGISASVEYITQMSEVMKYGVMRLPALVINEKVVCMGTVLSSAQIEQMLRAENV